MVDPWIVEDSSKNSYSFNEKEQKIIFVEMNVTWFGGLAHGTSIFDNIWKTSGSSASIAICRELRRRA